MIVGSIAFGSPASACNPDGDANNDGLTNCLDKAIVEPFFQSGVYNPAADLNCDDQVTVADAALFSGILNSCAGIGDVNGDDMINCDDEAILITIFATASQDPRGDLNCDGSVGVADAAIFPTLLNACLGTLQTVVIDCNGGSLQAAPATINATPGEWIHFTLPDVNCGNNCSSPYAVIDFPVGNLFSGGLSYVVDGGTCSIQIPATATAGNYKYIVTIYEDTGPGTDPVCTAITGNPLDPYIVVTSTTTVPAMSVYGLIAAALAIAGAGVWLVRSRLA